MHLFAKTSFTALAVALLLGLFNLACAQDVVDETLVQSGQHAAVGDVVGALEITRAQITKLPATTPNKGLLNYHAAGYLAQLKQNSEAIAMLRNCIDITPEASVIYLCRKRLEEYQLGRFPDPPPPVARVEPPKSSGQADASEASDSESDESPSYPVYLPPPPGYTVPPNRGRPPPMRAGYAQQGSAKDVKPTVNQCLQFVPTSDGRFALHNSCGFTVGYAFCDRSPERNAYSCASSMDARGTDFIEAGRTEQGYKSRPNWLYAACQGGAGSGTYPYLEAGRASCR